MQEPPRSARIAFVGHDFGISVDEEIREKPPVLRVIVNDEGDVRVGDYV